MGKKIFVSLDLIIMHANGSRYDRIYVYFGINNSIKLRVCFEIFHNCRKALLL